MIQWNIPEQAASSELLWSFSCCFSMRFKASKLILRLSYLKGSMLWWFSKQVMALLTKEMCWWSWLARRSFISFKSWSKSPELISKVCLRTVWLLSPQDVIRVLKYTTWLVQALMKWVFRRQKPGIVQIFKQTSAFIVSLDLKGTSGCVKGVTCQGINYS